jgi:hypothetical protein
MTLAYLDPGSGSLIVQVLGAGIAGVAVLAKVGWRRLVAPLRRRRTAHSAPLD